MIDLTYTVHRWLFLKPHLRLTLAHRSDFGPWKKQTNKPWLTMTDLHILSDSDDSRPFLHPPPPPPLKGPSLPEDGGKLSFKSRQWHFSSPLPCKSSSVSPEAQMGAFGSASCASCFLLILDVLCAPAQNVGTPMHCEDIGPSDSTPVSGKRLNCDLTKYRFDKLQKSILLHEPVSCLRPRAQIRDTCAARLINATCCFYQCTSWGQAISAWSLRWETRWRWVNPIVAFVLDNRWLNKNWRVMSCLKWRITNQTIWRKRSRLIFERLNYTFRTIDMPSRGWPWNKLSKCKIQ